MPRRAAIIDNKNLLVEHLFGTLNAVDMGVWMQESAAMKGFKPSVNQLVIIDTSVILNISVEETRKYAAMTPRFSKDSLRAYYVVDNDLVFGTLRLYEQERAESSGHIRVFKNLDHACDMVGINSKLIFDLWPDIKALV